MAHRDHKKSGFKERAAIFYGEDEATWESDECEEYEDDGFYGDYEEAEDELPEREEECEAYLAAKEKEAEAMGVIQGANRLRRPGSRSPRRA